MINQIDPRIYKALSLIQEDPAFPHTVSSLAGRVHVSPSHFRQLFKVQTGIPVATYVRRHRLAKSLHLFVLTKRPHHLEAAPPNI